jgi:hypothetical protein
MKENGDPHDHNPSRSCPAAPARATPVTADDTGSRRRQHPGPRAARKQSRDRRALPGQLTDRLGLAASTASPDTERQPQPGSGCGCRLGPGATRGGVPGEGPARRSAAARATAQVGSAQCRPRGGRPRSGPWSADASGAGWPSRAIRGQGGQPAKSVPVPGCGGRAPGAGAVPRLRPAASPLRVREWRARAAHVASPTPCGERARVAAHGPVPTSCQARRPHIVSERRVQLVVYAARCHMVSRAWLG